MDICFWDNHTISCAVPATVAQVWEPALRWRYQDMPGENPQRNRNLSVNRLSNTVRYHDLQQRTPEVSAYRLGFGFPGGLSVGHGKRELGIG